MHAQSTRRVALADAGRHQQQRLPSNDHSLLGLRGTNRRFHRFTLFRRERQRLRPRAGVGSGNPRLGIDHALPLQQLSSFGQISAQRY